MATKTLKFNYTSNISFVGLLTKRQFIQDVSDLTCISKNAIREELFVSIDDIDIKKAKKKAGHTIKVLS